MRKVLKWLAIAAVSAPLGFVLGAMALAQRGDYGWRPRVARPAFLARRPRVVIDQAHNNASTAAALAEAFGVRMHQGLVEVPNEVSDPLEFSRANGRLGEHVILAGDGPDGAIRRVVTFTGQSLSGPPGAAILLRLPATAVEYVASGPDLVPRPAGSAQGLALNVVRWLAREL